MKAVRFVGVTIVLTAPASSDDVLAWWLWARLAAGRPANDGL